MLLRIFVGFSIYEVVMFGLFQIELFSEGVRGLLEDFPIVGLIVFILYYMSKIQREENQQTRQWLEHMLEIQRTSLRDIYDGQRTILTALLNEIEIKQNKMADRVELLTQQLAVNTSTVSEVAKVDAIVSELIARLENK